MSKYGGISLRKYVVKRILLSDSNLCDIHYLWTPAMPPKLLCGEYGNAAVHKARRKEL